mgnify:CR=1 FL=1
MGNPMASILIIDDDPDIRAILIQYLNDLGHMPMVAETLADGIEMISAGAFDLIFLDVNLPDGDGLNAIPLIKQVQSTPEIIIITGEGNAKGAKTAIESGAWDYMVKPFSNHEIQSQKLHNHTGS